MISRQRAVLAVLTIGAFVIGVGATAMADPYFAIRSLDQWEEALGTGHVVPFTEPEWNNYMEEWHQFTEEGETYPETMFIEPVLYPYEGDAVPPIEDGTAGLVMAWGHDGMSDGSYAAAWKYDYLVDPDLSNAIITLNVFPPMFGPGSGITQISFGIQDMNGLTRSWFWNVGPGGTLPQGVPTMLTINTAITGVGATSPPADGYMNNPGFNIVMTQYFVADENGVLVGGAQPVPPPGGPPMAVWNYWYDIVVRPGGSSDYAFEFSLDIGSDTELSDPFMDGDEGFDPGDVYWWQSAPVVPPGRDGFKDDAFIFGNDPWPDPPDATGGTRVPVGEGSIEDYWEYFDLDAHDQTDFDLIEAQFPMPWFPSTCVHGPEFLMISFDDDKAPGWPAFDVPVTAPSPMGVSSYGTTGGRDEIVGLNVMVPAGALPPYPIMGMYPIADEVGVHQSLAPNPDNGEEDDDDVDSLDIVENEDTCPYWYFSPDHEAHLGLDPGGIYLVTTWGPFQVIDEFYHLGISEDADIDAFEFVWVPFPDGVGLCLALVFSVDDDDPLTGWDESGGLDPSMIFISWMTGFHMPFTDPLGEDIDALTIWREPIGEEPPTEACCLPDGTCIDVLPTDCMNIYGGTPMGAGTTCATLPPTLLAWPTDQAACENDDVTFAVIVCGSLPLHYQWDHDGTPVGGDSPVLTLADVRPADSGNYTVVVTNPYGASVAMAGLYVQAKADSNCDDLVNAFDIDAFVIALTDRTAWEAAYTCDYMCANDVNRDGAVNSFDIDPFVRCVALGGCP